MIEKPGGECADVQIPGTWNRADFLTQILIILRTADKIV